MENIRKLVGDNIRHYRKARGYTQLECAEKAGIHPRTFHGIENGDSWAESANIDSIAAALGVQPAQLLMDPELSNDQRLRRILAALAAANEGQLEVIELALGITERGDLVTDPRADVHVHKKLKDSKHK